MDNLLAGTLISLSMEFLMPGYCPASLLLLLFVCGKHSGLKPNAIPVDDDNCSPSHRNRRSLSDRNTVRIHNGMVFGFRPESRSSSTGFPTKSGCIASRR
jgi:hypothetical protein